MAARIKRIERGEIGDINYQIEQTRLSQLLSWS